MGCLFASYLLGSSLKVVLDMAPALLGGAVALALPLVSTWALRRAAASAYTAGQPRRGEELYRPGTYGTLARVALCVFVFCLARRIVSVASVGTATPWGQLVGHLVEIVFAAMALAWVYGCNRSLDFPQLWRFVFLFVTTAVVFDCVGAGSLWANVCNVVATSLIVMLLWLALSDVAHHCELHPYVVFGLGWSLYVGANFVGSWAQRELGVAELTPVNAVVLLWVLGVTMAFCLETRSPDVQRIFADLRTKVDPEEFATIDERCDQLAREHSLTDREVDVLKLLAKGRSKAFIAESLFISENTVRGHARRLYAKLGVHTKDELQGLIGL